jgi:hypothetical protein
MVKNVGSPDKIARYLIAVIAIIAAFLVGPGSALGIILFVVAAIMVATAALGFCPIWRVVGVNTNKSS